MSAEKILVTGGAGFIGSHTIVSLIESGYDPIILDNFSNSERSVLANLEEIVGRPVSFYEGNCCDEDILKEVFSKEKNIFGVIHFAAYKAVGESVAQPLSYYENNVGSLVALLKTMNAFGVINFVFSSSCTVYGQPDKLPVTEETASKKAESPYGNTKKVCEDIIKDHVKSQPRFNGISLRYFNPIGAHSSSLIGELPIGVPSNLIPFITQTAAGLREKLTVFGSDYNTEDGTCVRDFIHVMDLADAHVKAIDHMKASDSSGYKTFNVGTGNGNTVLEVIQAFEKVAGQKLNYEMGARRPGDVEQIYANVDKANKQLNWHAKRTLNESIESAWNWQKTLK